MKTIVIAIDHSPTADNALQFAANLADVFKAKLVLFNVYHLSAHVSNSRVSPETLDKIVVNNTERVRALAQDIADQYDIVTDFVIKRQEAVEEIKAYVKETQPDLVVMGMDTDIDHYKLFGNTTTLAIRHVECPLLVVPAKVKFKGINKIVFACEHRYLIHNDLQLLKEVSRKFDAELQILHVESPEGHDEEFEEAQVTAIEPLVEGTKHYYRFLEKRTVREGILAVVDEMGADLVVMVPHKISLWEMMTHGSDTRKIALRSLVPLLLIPNAD